MYGEGRSFWMTIRKKGIRSRAKVFFESCEAMGYFGHIMRLVTMVGIQSHNLWLKGTRQSMVRWENWEYGFRLFVVVVVLYRQEPSQLTESWLSGEPAIDSVLLPRSLKLCANLRMIIWVLVSKDSMYWSVLISWLS